MNEAQVYEKKGSHRALGDIKESVEELKFYKQLFMPDWSILFLKMVENLLEMDLFHLYFLLF